MTIGELTEGPLHEVWHYLGRAPLSVVIAVSLVCTGFSVAYTARVSSEDRQTAKSAELRATAAEQKAAVAEATDRQALVQLNRIEVALRELTGQVAATNALMEQHLKEGAGPVYQVQK